MTKKQWLIIGASSIVVLVVAVIVQLFFPRIAVSPPLEVQEPLSADVVDMDAATTSVSVKVVASKSVSKFPIHKNDTIVSWSFTGAYAGNDTLISKANADTLFLKGLLGKGQYSDYDLYVGIGNNYASLGDGAEAYAYYNKAISDNPNRAIVYTNIGILMEKIGAYNTALAAHTKAITLEPDIIQYSNARTEFLSRYPELIAQ